jgi:antitoxin component of MazEF toxin-antitoxin module
MTRISTDNAANIGFEVRRLQQQTDGRSLSVVIPTKYSKKLGLRKGDLLKIHIQDNRFLISEKINLDGIGSVESETEVKGVLPL